MEYVKLLKFHDELLKQDTRSAAVPAMGSSSEKILETTGEADHGLGQAG
jgi:hypothetical protein